MKPSRRKQRYRVPRRGRAGSRDHCEAWHPERPRPGTRPKGRVFNAGDEPKGECLNNNNNNKPGLCPRTPVFVGLKAYQPLGLPRVAPPDRCGKILIIIGKTRGWYLELPTFFNWYYEHLIQGINFSSRFRIYCHCILLFIFRRGN